MILNEIKNIKSARKDLRDFGFIIAIAFLIFFIVYYFKNNAFNYYFLVISVVFTTSALLIPVLLLPFQKAWMTLAILLNWIMTRVILSLLYYLAITPLGLFFKIKGRDFMDKKIDKQAKTYWQDRSQEKEELENYEKQY